MMSFDLARSSPVQASNHGSFDGFIAQLNRTGSALLFASYGAAAWTICIFALALAGRSLWAAGYTSSADFQEVANGSLPGPNGGYDAFVTQLQVSVLPPSLISVSPASGNGIQQTFAFQVADPAGYGNISLLLMEIGPGTSSNTTCLLFYSPPATPSPYIPTKAPG